MKIRIGAENLGGNVEGLPSPRMDLVFENLGAGQIRMNIVEVDGIVSSYGPAPPYLNLSIRALRAVVVALEEVAL